MFSIDGMRDFPCNKNSERLPDQGAFAFGHVNYFRD